MKQVLPIPLILLLGGGAYYACTCMPEEETELRLSGNVDVRTVRASFRVGGRLESLTAEEGSRVTKGEPLGRLDAQPYEIALRQAESNTAVAEAALAQARSNETAARAALALLEKGYRREEIAKAAAELAAQEVLALNAEKEYRRMQGLVRQSAVSEQNLDDAEKEYRSRKAMVDANRAVLEQMQAGYRTEEIDKAKAQLLTATAAVAEAEARCKTAEAQRDQARLNLGDVQLTAPADGIVMTRAVEPGTMLTPGEPVFTISLREPIRIRAWVDAVYLDKVHLGQQVSISSDSGCRYTGTVSYVSPQAEFTPKTVETADIRTTLVYRIQVTIPPGRGEA